jgi:uracil-DNA glycosylase
MNTFQTWHPFVVNWLQGECFFQIERFLNAQPKEQVLPPQHNRFKAFELTSFKSVKVIILGQDPYHGKGQAHGLSFSVPDGIKIPPSLVNIYQELLNDLNIKPNTNGNLEHWATQGVLLLNALLSVEKNKPGSHAKIGWSDFTDGIIKSLSKEKEHLVFILWGAYAQKKSIFIDNKKHLILKASHPSPLSAYRGFLGSKPFSKTNSYLKKHHQTTINW